MVWLFLQADNFKKKGEKNPNKQTNQQKKKSRTPTKQTTTLLVPDVGNIYWEEPELVFQISKVMKLRSFSGT